MKTPLRGHHVSLLLRPLNEFPSFWYLNEIGVKIEHFNSTTLSDKWSQKVKENQ
jgi:hypothetical protein